MSNAEATTPKEDPSQQPRAAVNLVEQIIDATLSDARVTQRLTPAGLLKIRELLVATKLAKSAELVAAANHEEQKS